MTGFARYAALLALTWLPTWAGEWNQLTPTTSPPPRANEQGLVYDEVGDRLILFGGGGALGLLGDTWQWDETDWVELFPATSPPARSLQYMAYDSARDVIVLYGGAGDGFDYSDMWEFDGTDWSQVFPTATPGNRFGGGMAYDRDRGVVVLYGGHRHGCCDLNDTWEYDGTTWYQVSTTVSPGVFNGQRMVYDRVRRQVVLSGGCGNGDRAWLYDGADWIEGPIGPPSRNDLSMAYHVPSGRTVVFGGSVDCGQEARQDTWEWNGSSWQEVTPTGMPPSARWAMAMEYYPGSLGLIAFGGGPYNVVTNETWLYQPCPGDVDCDGVTDGTDNCPEIANPSQSDRDADGFGAACDCNDASPTTYPGAPEVCDGYDNDCSGQVDDGPECVTSCDSLTPLSDPMIAADPGDTFGAAPSIVWTGEELGVAWADRRDGNLEIYFRRLDAGGVPLAGATRITNDPAGSGPPSLTWTGTNYAVTWRDERDGGGQIYWTRIETSGAPMDDPVRVNVGSSALYSRNSSLAWTGREFGVIWEEHRGIDQVYFVRLTSEGAVIGNAGNVANVHAREPVIAWTGDGFGVAWQDGRHHSSGNIGEIYFARLDGQGDLIAPEVRVTDELADSRGVALVWNGQGFGLTWFDGSENIWFARLDSEGQKIGENVRLTYGPTVGSDARPAIAWTGSEYAVAWNDTGVAWGVYLQRLTGAGARTEPPVRLSGINVPGYPSIPTLAWTGFTHAVAWQDSPGEIYTSQVACTCTDSDDDDFCADTLASPRDCDDSNPLVYPGAAEVCDGLNNDCNDTIWPDLPPMESDDDADTYSECTGDCDDTNETVYPSAPELCDRLNNNCNDSTWPSRPASDSDDDVDTFSECEGDCDDTRASVFPGAPQLCDGINNDCLDGGWPAVSSTEVDDDTDTYSECQGDCNDANAAVNPDAIEICNSIDDNCNTLIDEDALGEDSDGDGVHNLCDNCREDINPSQLDVDQDNVGNSCDNCVLDPNPEQADLDLDQRGDMCDNCPGESNFFQDDWDGDSHGDACDNCFFIRNVNQTDMDTDFEGDYCELDDGVIYILFHQPEYVEWQEEMGYMSWNSYRGDVGVLRSTGVYTQTPGSNPNAAKTCGILDPWLLEGDPPVGTAAFYLTTGNGIDGENPLGLDGLERTNSNPCP